MLRLFGRKPAQTRTAPPVAAEPVRADRQAAPAAARGYRAARPDRLLNRFSALFSTNPREELRQDIRGLINHARYAAQNYDQARALEHLVRRNVIGPDGIRMVPDVRQTDRGRPNDRDENANSRISDAWKRWGEKRRVRRQSVGPSICGRLSWWDIERISATHLVREGGLFIREHITRDGLKLEPLPWDLIEIDKTEPLPGGGMIESGVEFDADGRILALHTWTVPPNVGHYGRSQMRRRIPVTELVQVIDHSEIGLTLGYPRTATSLRMMGLAEQFEESAMVAADMGARGAVFFETQDGAVDLTDEGADTTPPDGYAMQAGSFTGLPPGVRANVPDWKYPDAAVGDFLGHFDQRAAAGLGISTESLTANLRGANYSSLHHGAVGERDTWRELQRVMVENLCQPIFSDWLDLSILSGSLGLPASKRDKFDAATWHPRGWPAVDPLKQANADKTGLESGTVTLTEIAARKGRTLPDLIAERSAERDALEAAGLPFAAAQPAVPAPSGAAPDMESVDDET